MPSRYRDTWSRQSPSWYLKDWKSSQGDWRKNHQRHVGGPLASTKILHNKKGNLGQTNKTNTEANTKVYDLNQKTMKALESLGFPVLCVKRAGKDLNEEYES